MADLPKAQAGPLHTLPRIRSVLAPNPSAMTGAGTNTYILGEGRVAVIDPGPAIDAHLAAILAILHPQESISHIFVTHAHLDHSALAPALASVTGAPVHAFGGATAGRSLQMQRVASRLDIGGGEGVDHAFSPDVYLADGAIIHGDTWCIEALHTPGHMGNHLCFAAQDTLFSGDHVMGWSSTLISPPDGDKSDYMASLEKLAARSWCRFLPGHGTSIEAPAQRLADLAAHRIGRDAALMAALTHDARSIVQLARIVYVGLDPALLPAAHRNILAHLIDLEARNLITASPYPSFDADFRIA